MTTKRSGGRITGLLALTLESTVALAVGDPVQVSADYTVVRANGTKPVVGHVSVANVRRDSVTGQFPVSRIPGDVTVEARGFEVRTIRAGEAILAGVEVGYNAASLLVMAGGTGTVGTGAVNETQVLTTATSGNTTVAFDGETTAALTLAATPDAAAVTALLNALNGLSNINPGDVLVALGSGATAGRIVITFAGRYASVDVPLATATGTGAAIAAGTVPVAAPIASIGFSLMAAAAALDFIDVLVR